MTKKIRVIILDDHVMTVDGYLLQLRNALDIEVVATLTYGDELEPALVRSLADVLLLDVEVPNNAEDRNPYPIWHLIPKLLERYSGLAILIISMHDQPGLIDMALEAGVSGYILKSDQEAYRSLAEIMRKIAYGDIYYSPAARQRWERRQEMRRKGGAKGKDVLLSPRQLETVSLCVAYPDDTTDQLAKRLSVEPSTTRNLLSQIYFRLGVSSRAAALAEVRRRGMLLPDGNRLLSGSQAQPGGVQPAGNE